MWKVNDGRRTTDDGQRVITIVHLSLRLRCTKKFAYEKLKYLCTETKVERQKDKQGDSNTAKFPANFVWQYDLPKRQFS